MNKSYSFDEKVFQRHAGKKVYTSVRAFGVLFALVFLTSCVCSFLNGIEYIEFGELIPNIWIIIISACLISLYFFGLSIYNYIKVISKVIDIQIMLDKDIVNVLIPSDNKDAIINIYQCKIIESIAIQAKEIVIKGKLTKNELVFDNISSNSVELTEMTIPRVFSEDAEKMLKSKVGKEGENNCA